MHAIDTAVVVWLAPNVLRVFCLHFVSSNMHYYGDVESGNIVQQCQVLNPWWLWPAQLFCFNFGATHAIQHFVVSQPFYVRPLTAIGRAPFRERVCQSVSISVVAVSLKTKNRKQNSHYT